jgi:type 2 lantibiotic biosynthesis protein LanM
VKLVNRAATLHERIESFRANDTQFNQEKVPNLQETLSTWKEKIGPRVGAWTNCLAWNGLNESDIPNMLQTSPFSENNLPEWAKEMELLIDYTSCQYGLDKSSGLVPDEPFYEIWEIFRSYALSRLMAQLQVSGIDIKIILTEQACSDLLGALIVRLQEVGLPLLYHEFDQVRPIGFRSLASLLTSSGVETSATSPAMNQYYNKFTHGILQSGFCTLFETYPVLGRLFGEIISQWKKTAVEFLLRLQKDSQDLAREFGLDSNVMKRVQGLRMPLSDYHQCGRTVIAVKFSTTEIIYKPKDITLERDFNKLLETINRRLKIPFKTNTVLCLEGYGWAGMIKYEACSDLASVGRFYERFGALLALLNGLRATDCHYENVIASGEYPVLIDMETLMHPEVGWVDETRKILRDASPNRHFFDSVLRVGVLPTWQFNADETVAYDISSLGYTEVENLMVRRTSWRWCGTDLIHPISEPVMVQRPDNVPTLGDQSFEADEFLEQLVVGFEQTYRLIMCEWETIFKHNSHFLAMQNSTVRFIFRTSQVYGMIMKGAWKSDCLRDGVRYGLEFEVLARVFMSCEEKPSIWPLLLSEIRQMTNLDIPYFQASNESTNLNLTTEVFLENYFESASFEDAIKELNSLCDEDLKRQLLLIRGSFLARSGHIAGGVNNRQLMKREPSQIGNTNFYKFALEMGDRIASNALWEKDTSCNWYGISFIASAKRFQLKPLGYNLYDGSSGVGLFFSALYAISKNEEHSRLAKAATHEIRELLAQSSSSVAKRIVQEMGIGVGTGLGSITYSLIKIADFINDPLMAADAVRVCCTMREHISSDVKFDVLDGTAGGLLAALAVYRSTGVAEALEIAMECGIHLLSLRDAFQSGYSDVWIYEGNKLPIGFAHGASGIAYAISSLYACSKDERFKDFAYAAMTYEDSVFAMQGTLPLQGHTSSWCNGIGGFALARLKCSYLLGSDAPERWRNDALACLAVLDSSDLNGPDHLCCGQFGRIEIQQYAASVLLETGLHDSAVNRAIAIFSEADVYTDFRLHPTIRDNSYFPGFFQGTAGIGYALLRLHAAHKFPNVLAFD